MKQRLQISVMLTMVMAMSICNVYAENKVFTESGEILEGEVWDIVDVFGDDTIVDMSGGSVDYISTFDSSTLNMSGGLAEVGAFETSTINISGGSLFSGANAYDGGTVNLLDCDYSIDLRVYESGTGNMFGGTVEYLIAGDFGTLDLYGGVITDSLGAWESSLVNVHGYDLYKTTIGGIYGYGQVSGFYLDDKPFTIDFYNAETYSHVNLIPEPSTLVLMGFGVLVSRTC